MSILHRLRSMSFGDEEPTSAMRAYRSRREVRNRAGREGPIALGNRQPRQNPPPAPYRWPSGSAWDPSDGASMQAAQDAARAADEEAARKDAKSEWLDYERAAEAEKQEQRDNALLDSPRDEPNFYDPTPRPPLVVDEYNDEEPSRSQYGIYGNRPPTPQTDEEMIERAVRARDKQREIARKVAFVKEHLEHYESGMTDWKGFLAMLTFEEE